VHGLAERPDALEILWKRLEKLLAGGRPPPESGEPWLPGNTTHISTLDSGGNAASLTLSYGEGNGYAIGDTGVLMNNLLGEADLFPQGFHRFTAGERLKTMMAPTIMQAPSGVVTVLGSGGSNRIRTVIPQVISALVDDGNDPRAAVDRARIHYEDGVLSAEAYLMDNPETVLSSAASLAGESRWFEARSLFFGGVHLTRRNGSGKLEGVGDPRRGGVVRAV
jgi:gamma-glutamyltranspeptidase/glutathione hydrolase